MKSGHDTLQLETEQVTDHHSTALSFVSSVVPVHVHGRLSEIAPLQNTSTQLQPQTTYETDNEVSGDEFIPD